MTSPAEVMATKIIGVDVGGTFTDLILMDEALLGSYTLGCHSLRHLVGGRHDCISELPTRKIAYDCVSCLNRRHMLFAWLSLAWVTFSDVYVRLCSMGVWTDFRIF